MKFFFLFVLFLCFLPGTVLAQTDFFTSNKTPAKPTPAQIDESFALYDQCQATDMINKYYSCDCLARIFLDLRARLPRETRDNLITAARKKCPNTVDIAGASYQRCMDWAPQVRSDYNRYCACYANTFARSFSATPTDSIRGREAIMANALSGCNDASQLAEANARERTMQSLKKQGIYETLFPNARSKKGTE